MVWYGKNKEEKRDSSDRFKKDEDVSLTARYLNSDDDDGETTVHDNYEDDISLTTMRGND